MAHGVYYCLYKFDLAGLVWELDRSGRVTKIGQQKQSISCYGALEIVSVIIIINRLTQFGIECSIPAERPCTYMTMMDAVSETAQRTMTKRKYIPAQRSTKVKVITSIYFTPQINFKLLTIDRKFFTE